MKGIHSSGKTIKVGRREARNQGSGEVTKRSKEKLREEDQNIIT
jgi:hypothetical protein